MNTIKEIRGHSHRRKKEKKKDICSHIFHSVAEIRVRDDNRVKKEEETKYWIFRRTRLNIIIYSWGVVEKGW